MSNVGIVTWHYYQNFGSALQAFALQTIIEKMGNKCEIINYRNPKFGYESTLKTKIKYLLSKTLVRLPIRIDSLFFPYVLFQRDYMNESKTKYYFADDIDISEYDTIISGSDQIWAPNVFNPVYMLSFVKGNTKKVSYAASIGLNSIPNDLQKSYTEYLSSFSAISVREQQGKELLQCQCGIKSEVVLDPTLLIDKTIYRSMEKKVSVGNKYVFCYFLNPEHQYTQTLRQYTQENKCEIIGFSARTEDAQWMKLLKQIGPQEFLWLIDNAECVFTDSYHGTIFSLIFHKEFWTFQRFNKEDPICQNSRIFQLDSYFGIAPRILCDGNAVSDNKIDYHHFDRKLEELQSKSMRFLSEALE